METTWNYRGWRFLALRGAAMLCISGFLVGCGTTSEAPITIRLIDQFEQAVVEGTVPFDVPAPIEWRFDGGGTLAVRPESADTFGWQAISGIEGLAAREGLLVGRTSNDEAPTLSAALPDTLKEGFLHAVEVRMRVSEGTRAGVWFGPNFEAAPDRARGDHDVFAMVSVPLEPGTEFQTYRLTNDAQTFPLGALTPRATNRFAIRHVQVEPTDAAGAEFAIESIRLITRVEHLRSIASGPGWNALGYIDRETIVSRSPQRVRFEVKLGLRPWLDLAVGTLEDGPVTFTVEVGTANHTRLLRRTVTLPGQWERTRLDLSDFAGQRVALRLGLDAEQPGTLGFWGSPVVRHSGALPRRTETSPARAALPDAGTSVPQGVILILADTLRSDHLNAYGHQRPTAPVLARLASEGVLFSDSISQAPWTKPSVPSILSSLYPSTHGVTEYSDLLPSSVVTLAEVYRDAGYATFHTAANAWAGTPSHLEQGVEVLHRGGSLRSDTQPSMTARGFVTRFLEWLEMHDDVPFFAFLHFFDPHGPREPYPPYDTMWAAPSARGEQEMRWQKLEKAGVHAPYIQNEERSDRVPAVALLQKAEVDPEAFIAHEFAWYDGSIRAMDVEIGRLLEGLEARGLADKTLVAFVSDHGEEFLDHGYLGHGHTAYGELLNIPLLLWWPGVGPAGLRIEETVESIDLMPTLLDLSGLATVEGIQGQSLVPFLARPASPSVFGWVKRGAFSEKTVGGRATEYASTLVLDGWKLIQNDEPLNGRSKYELYEHRMDPLDQQDVASEHPEVVERLGKELTLRREQAIASRIPSEDVPAESLSSEQIRRLRSLGYLQ